MATSAISADSPEPVADPPVDFATEGWPVGPPNVVVGYGAAFTLERGEADGAATAATVIATNLGDGEELWRWEADATAWYLSNADGPSKVLALSRDGDAESMQFTGVYTTERSGTHLGSSVLRTTVLDTATGEVLGSGEAALPAEVTETITSFGDPVVEASSIGVRGKFAVSTITTKDTGPMTLVTDLETGTAAWAAAGFFATGLSGTGAVGVTVEDAQTSYGSLQAVALETRRPMWIGKTVRISSVAAVTPTLVAADAGDPLEEVTRFYNADTGKDFGALDKTADCRFDQRDVIVCESIEDLVGIDATSLQQLWKLPDEAANRIDPDFDFAFHGRVYAQGVILDAHTGDDVVTNVPVTADEIVPGYAITRESDRAIAYPATG